MLPRRGLIFQAALISPKKKMLFFVRVKYSMGMFYLQPEVQLVGCFYNETMTFSEMRINSGMVILRNLGVVSPEYIYTSLRHEYLQKLMTMYASGSAQPQLPIKDMKRMKIIKSDTKTMERFTEMSADIYNQISLLIMKNQTLAKQRDMLLPRLMSGKLEV